MRRNGKDRETEELFRKFQGILNKLTPQKFQNLAKQVLQLKIDNEERLEGCIDKIFTSVRKGGRDVYREGAREQREEGKEGQKRNRLKCPSQNPCH